MMIGKKDIKITCDACPYSGTLNSVHRWTGYMMKNPPCLLVATDETAGAAGRKLSKTEKQQRRAATKDANLLEMIAQRRIKVVLLMS